MTEEFNPQMLAYSGARIRAYLKAEPDQIAGKMQRAHPGRDKSFYETVVAWLESGNLPERQDKYEDPLNEAFHAWRDSGNSNARWQEAAEWYIGACNAIAAVRHYRFPYPTLEVLYADPELKKMPQVFSQMPSITPFLAVEKPNSPILDEISFSNRGLGDKSRRQQSGQSLPDSTEERELAEHFAIKALLQEAERQDPDTLGGIFRRVVAIQKGTIKLNHFTRPDVLISFGIDTRLKLELVRIGMKVQQYCGGRDAPLYEPLVYDETEGSKGLQKELGEVVKKAIFARSPFPH